jgi:ribosomal protein S27E
MPLINCPECNHSVSDSARTCPSCGFGLATKQGKTNYKLSGQFFRFVGFVFIVFGIVFCFTGVGLIIGLSMVLIGAFNFFLPKVAGLLVVVLILFLGFKSLFGFPTLIADAPKEISTLQEYSLGNTVLLKGYFHKDTFNDCCFNGESKKENYLYIELPNKVKFIDDDNTNGYLESKVQIAWNQTYFEAIKEGRGITVKCGNIFASPTGHYALPIYCDSPSVEDLR